MFNATRNWFRRTKNAHGTMVLGIAASFFLSACSGRAQESFISIDQLISCIRIGKTDDGVVNIEVSGPFIVSTEGFGSNMLAHVKGDGSIYVFVSVKNDTNVSIAKPGGDANDEFIVHSSPNEMLIFYRDLINPIRRYDISTSTDYLMVPLSEVRKNK